MIRRSAQGLLFLILAVFAWPLLALAQEVVAKPASPEASSVMQLVLQGAEVVLSLAIAGAVLALGRMLLAKAHGTIYEATATKLWNLFLTNAHDAWAKKIHPKWEQIIADGKVTPEEWNELLATLIDSVREQVGERLSGILGTLGVTGKSESFLASMAQRAIAAVLEKRGLKMPAIGPVVEVKPTPPAPAVTAPGGGAA